MSDQILTLKELEDFFAQITYKILGLDSTINKGKVRLAWQKNNAPSWKIEEDIVFLRVTPIDDRQARLLNIIYNKNEEDNEYLKKKTGYTRVHKIDWCFYGPNSYDNADLIRFSILEPHLYKQNFKDKNLFIITDVQMPTRLPELYNGLWWERTDFSASFNEAVIRESKMPYIKSAEIKMDTDEANNKEIDITTI